MLSAYQRPVSSKPTVDFLEALATNEASATVNLRLPLRDPAWFIRAITIDSVENLAWELQLFTRATNSGGTLPTDYFLGVWQFSPLVVGPPASPGWPFLDADGAALSNFYHFYVDGNMMPYYDLDQMTTPNPLAGDPTKTPTANQASLHCRLINRSAAGKTAAAAGALIVTFFMAPQGAQA